MNGKLEQVQVLRGLASVLVVIAHIGILTTQSPYARNFDFLKYAGIGVDIFFVISGFIISYSASKMIGFSDVLIFLRKRLIRVVPLYWLYTALFVVFVLFFHSIGRMNSYVIDGGHILKSLAFIPSPSPRDGRYIPFLEQGWSLNFEVFFYVIYSLIIIFCERIRLLISFVLFAFIYFVGEYFSINIFYGSALLFEFILGVGVYAFRERLLRLRVDVKFFVLIFFMGLFVFCGDYINDLKSIGRLCVWGGFSGAIFISVLSVSKKFPTWIVAIGDYSYSLYLSHTLVILLLVSLQRFFWSSILVYCIYIVFSILISVAVGVVLGSAIERPLMSVLSSRK